MKLAAYTRVSRVGDRAETLLSPELQAEAIKRWAGKNHILVPLPPELDESGGKENRPILTRAIEAIEAGEIDGVAVAKLNRFSRMSLGVALRTLERIEDAGGKVFSATENIDPTTPAGRKFRNDLFTQANYEKEIQAEGFEVAKADAIARGVWTAPHVPLGYFKNAERLLELDPLTAPVARRAFEMRSQGASWREIADTIGSALDRPFHGPTVARMIASRTYLGEARQGEYVNLNAHPPIVDLMLWQAAQRQMPRPARGKHPVALLGGLIRCSGCSRRMSSTFTKRGDRQYRQYRCRVHGAGGTCLAPAAINAQTVEPLIAEAVLSRIEDLTATASERNRGVESAEAELAAAEAELAAFVEGTRALSNQEAFRAGAEARSQAVDEAKARLAGARLQAPQVPAPERVRSLWPKLSEAERNQVLRASLDTVWIKRGRGAGRVRLVAAGHGPTGLSRQGKVFDPVAAPWPKGDLPGEIGMPSPQDAK